MTLHNCSNNQSDVRMRCTAVVHVRLRIGCDHVVLLFTRSQYGTVCTYIIRVCTLCARIVDFIVCYMNKCYNNCHRRYYVAIDEVFVSVNKNASRARHSCIQYTWLGLYST